MVKRSTGLVVESADRPNLDEEVDEKLTDEVQIPPTFMTLTREH
jgi:hypothetical protein